MSPKGFLVFAAILSLALGHDSVSDSTPTVQDGSSRGYYQQSYNQPQQYQSNYGGYQQGYNGYPANQGYYGQQGNYGNSGYQNQGNYGYQNQGNYGYQNQGNYGHQNQGNYGYPGSYPPFYPGSPKPKLPFLPKSVIIAAGNDFVASKATLAPGIFMYNVGKIESPLAVIYITQLLELASQIAKQLSVPVEFVNAATTPGSTIVSEAIEATKNLF